MFDNTARACSGTSGDSSMSRSAESRRLLKVASASLSPAGAGTDSSVSTSARRYGSVCTTRRTRKRACACTIKTTVPSGCFINLSTCALTPTGKRSLSPGFSASSSRWVMRPITRVCGDKSSASFKAAGRPSVSGTTVPGKTTTPRTGSRARVSGTPGAPGFSPSPVSATAITGGDGGCGGGSVVGSSGGGSFGFAREGSMMGEKRCRRNRARRRERAGRICAPRRRAFHACERSGSRIQSSPLCCSAVTREATTFAGKSK